MQVENVSSSGSLAALRVRVVPAILRIAFGLSAFPQPDDYKRTSPRGGFGRKVDLSFRSLG